MKYAPLKLKWDSATKMMLLLTRCNSFTLLFVFISIFFGNAALAGLSVPDCPSLMEFAKKYDPGNNWDVTPKISLPAIFSDKTSSAVFGSPAISWNSQETMIVRKAVTDCRNVASRQKNKEMINGMKNFRKLLSQLTKSNKSIERAQKTIEIELNKLYGEPDVGAQVKALNAVINAIESLKHSGSSNRRQRGGSNAALGIIRQLINFPYTQAADLSMELKNRLATINMQQNQSTEEIIRSAPATALGLLQIRKELLSAKINRLFATMPEEFAALETTAEKRMINIREQLITEAKNNRKESTIVPPTCKVLYRWGGADGSRNTINLPTASTYKVFTDEYVLPAFYKGITSWTEIDINIYQNVSGLCNETRQIKPEDTELTELARNGEWIVGRVPEIRKAKQILHSYNDAVNEFSDLHKEMADLTISRESLPKLDSYLKHPVLQQIDQQIRRDFAAEVNSKRAKIFVETKPPKPGSELPKPGSEPSEPRQAIDFLDKELTKLKKIPVDSLEDLKKLFRQRDQTLVIYERLGIRHLNLKYKMAFRELLNKYAEELEPEFKKRLAEIPETEEGNSQAWDFLSELIGTGLHESILMDYSLAARRRASNIADGAGKSEAYYTCGPTPSRYKQQEYGAVLFALERSCNRPFSFKEQVFIGGMVARILSMTKKCDVIPSDNRFRMKLYKFEIASKAIAFSSDYYTTILNKTAIRIAGGSAFKEIGCTNTGRLIAKGVLNFLDSTSSETKYVKGCASYFSHIATEYQYTRQQCQCLADAGRSIIPNIHKTEFRLESVYKIMNGGGLIFNEALIRNIAHCNMKKGMPDYSKRRY